MQEELEKAPREIGNIGFQIYRFFIQKHLTHWNRLNDYQVFYA